MKSKTIILSIHPRHVQKILSGEKLYEYRKRIPIDINYIIVYATTPIKKIVAVIEIDTVLKDTPQNIWGLTKDDAGVSYEFFMNYFNEISTANAVKFRNVQELPIPADITIVNGVKCAPQAFVYVDEPLEELCEKFNIRRF